MIDDTQVEQLAELWLVAYGGEDEVLHAAVRRLLVNAELVSPGYTRVAFCLARADGTVSSDVAALPLAEAQLLAVAAPATADARPVPASDGLRGAVTIARLAGSALG